MERVRGILLHISVVCSLICITTKILDYYNPYMDFSGNTVGFQFVLYVAVIALAVTRTYKTRQKKSKKTYYKMLNNLKYV